ncbi:hypothetical protein Z043_109224 [Scleropages formosus]|uniref:Titin-cap (telethonin) n=1 Tax=Scleropages formosus TaxID=113540 RepID=A0A0P7X4V8_SCLFO|nr:hypothetical protein Z043_109224 [Scleropages formosus]
MLGRTVLLKRQGSVAGAKLACGLREENGARRESYSADWDSVNLRTRPEEGQTVREVDERRRESFSRQWEARRLVQACPSGVVRLGTLEQGVQEHRQLPCRNTLPLPLFAPSELGVRMGRGAAHDPEDPRAFPVPDGACPSKRDVSDITKGLPPVQPMRMDFAKAPRSLGRSMSQEAQRG